MDVEVEVMDACLCLRLPLLSCSLSFVSGGRAGGGVGGYGCLVLVVW